MAKPYIDLNTKLRQKVRTKFENDFFKSMNNHVFGKTMENVRNIKLVTTEGGRNYLVLEPNYHTTKIFTQNLSAIEMRNLQYQSISLSI